MDWASRRGRYRLVRAIDLPHVPREGDRFCCLFPDATEIVVCDEDESDEDEDGLPVARAIYDLMLDTVHLYFCVTVVLPWESSEENIEKMIPGWSAVFD
jgi:hypothetical protein